MTKRWLIVVTAILTIVATLLWRSGQTPTTPPITNAAATNQLTLDTLLLEYPHGPMASQATLLYRFNQAVIPPATIGKAADSVFSSVPAGLFSGIWLDEKTLQLTPKGALASGQSIAITLHGQPLSDMGVVQHVTDFQSAITVSQQRLSITEQGFAINNDEVSYSLQVDTDEDVSKAQLLQLLVLDESTVKTATLEATQVAARRWNLVVRGLTKGPGSFRLRWKHQLQDRQFVAERVLPLPMPDELSVLSTRFSDHDGQRFEIRFSQPLASQDLAGLVKLNDEPARARINGNELQLFPANKLSGKVRVWLAATLKAADGRQLGSAYQHELQVSALLPAIKFLGNGQIMPRGERLLIPIEATNISAVQLRVFQIFPDNIPQFLQSSDDNWQSWRTDEVGRYLSQRTIALKGAVRDTTTTYQLDVTELMGNYRGSIFRLEARLQPEHSLYPCDVPLQNDPLVPLQRLNYEGYYKESDIPERLWAFYRSRGDYEWSERDNPCKSAFYNANREISKTIIASNIGLIAKAGKDGVLHVFSTALDIGKPLADVSITAYNYQQQVIGRAQTDASGMATIKPEGESFFLKAEKAGDTGYVKVVGNNALPTNQFDSGGVSSQHGVNAFFYAERNVWRPGDTIYLNLIVQDKAAQIPPDFPVTVDLFSPQGQKVSSLTARPVGAGFYRFDLATAVDATTGNYTAVAKIADTYVDTLLKVENILPNRLKLDLALPPLLSSDATPLTLQSSWLSGANAQGLQADVEVKLSAGSTEFDGLQHFHFDDARRPFDAQKTMAWQGRLGPTGNASFILKPELNTTAPGALRALFIMRVFEPSGQFSTQFKQTTLHPYQHYIGLSIPTEYEQSPLADDGTMAISLVRVDATGRKQPASAIELSLHKLSWRWWWDESEQSSRYTSDADSNEVSKVMLTTDASGFASFTLDAKNYDHGRYRIVACDRTNNGHCTSRIVYIGWGWQEQQGRDSATRLGITADKDSYQVGDTARINLPAATARQVLLTLENGSQVLDKRWYSLAPGQNSLDIRLDKRMVPNVYAHVSQLLPHANRPSDLPLRSYGLVNLSVTDPASELQPVLEMPSDVKPESQLTIKVKEQHGQAMTYTLALVDEGLLGITDFKTPDPHAAFFRREALGVRSWDLFDQVVGAYASDLSRLLAVGGSELIAKRDNKRLQRFKPLVHTIGPLTLAAGQTAQHQISLPPYVGAARVMLIAGNGYAYGRTEGAISIRQDLDLLTTAPRLVGPGDEFSVPVTVFWQGKTATDVNVSVNASNALELIKASATAHFNGPGEQTVQLKIKALEQTGTATLTVQATAGALHAKEQLHLPLRAPTATEQRIISQWLQPSAEWKPNAERFGIAGSNQQWFNIHRLQNFDLTSYLLHLSDYPHSCVEQSTSRVLPLLFAGRYQAVTSDQQADMTTAIKQQLQALAKYQQPAGRFAYWRDSTYYVDWADVYAGYFMVKAKRQGYAMAEPTYSNWLNYHKTQANQFDSRDLDLQIVQAMRLWVLAMADTPDQGAMNRLRDAIKTDTTRPLARWLLALAYVDIGQLAAARELADATSLQAQQQAQSIFAQPAVQSAIRLQTLFALGLQDNALSSAQTLLLNQDIRSEATLGQALTAQILSEQLSQAHASEPVTRKVQLVTSGTPLDIEVSHAGYSLALPTYQAKQFAVRNTGNSPLYVSLLQQGIPAAGTEQPSSQGLTLSSAFTDLQGQPIDIHSIQQGADIIAWLTIENTTAEPISHIAVSQLFAAGFELRSALLAQESQSSAVSHQTSGDDRLYTYVDLGAHGSATGKLVLKATLNATYAGRFYLPGWTAQSMYVPSIRGALAGTWLEISP